MFKKIKITGYFVVKYLGGFWLARQMNKGNTCVLCYHGFAYQDESEFRPKLFMKPETFAKRIAWLKSSPYDVVSLGEAIQGDDKKNYVALTMDDGWAATLELVGDVLAEHKLPLMLYVTSYYAKKQGAVINVALAYLLWKSKGKNLFIDDERLKLHKTYTIMEHNITEIVSELYPAIDAIDDFQGRQEILLQISKQLEVTLFDNKRLMFRALTVDELKRLKQYNVDIQLHTHRHCSPQDEASFKLEIQENIESLLEVSQLKDLKHFCFPSGEYYQQQIPWLKECGVISATTVSGGVLTAETDSYQIPRLLDGEDVHQLEFEAELCGLTNFFRRGLKLVK